MSIKTEAMTRVLMRLYLDSSILFLLIAWTHCLSEIRSPPIILYPKWEEDVIYYMDNNSTRISCTVQSHPPASKFAWTLNGTVISGRSHIWVSEGTGVLHISKFSAALQGRYRCKATTLYNNSHGVTFEATAVSKPIYLRRAYLEYFWVRGQSAHRAIRYHYYEQPCGDRGISTGPGLRYDWINWHSARRMHTSDGRVFINKVGTIFITSIDWPEDTHRIYCIITFYHNGYTHCVEGYTHQYNIGWATNQLTKTVPVLKYVSPTVIARRHTDAVLECVFHVIDPILNEYRIHKWLDEAGRRINDSAKHSIYYGGKRLTIRRVTEADEMNYTCYAENSLGRTSAQIFVDVLSPPVFISGPPVDQTVLQGRDAQFTCHARSVSGESPASQTVWYINGNPSSQSYDHRNIHLNLLGTTLIITNAQKETDIMCIQCEISNDYDTTVANACLNVILPIAIIEMPPWTQTVVYGDLLNVTVQAEGDPLFPLSYMWEFGNVSVEGNNTPPYFIKDPVTNETYVNTSFLLFDDMMALLRHFNIVVYHQYESKVLEMSALLLTPESSTPEPIYDGDGSPLPPGQRSSLLPGTTTKLTENKSHSEEIPWLFLIIGLVLLAAVLFGIITAFFMWRKKGPTGTEEENPTQPPPTDAMFPSKTKTKSLDYGSNEGTPVDIQM